MIFHKTRQTLNIFEQCSFTIRGRKGHYECTPPGYTSTTEKPAHMDITLKRMTHAAKVGYVIYLQ